MVTTVVKASVEDLDYEIDWSKRNLGTTDTIATSTWAIEGPDQALTYHSPGINVSLTAVIIWLTAGTVNDFYTVTNTIVTAQGRTYQESFIVSVVATNYI
jgi:hypothetical protein